MQVCPPPPSLSQHINHPNSLTVFQGVCCLWRSGHQQRVPPVSLPATAVEVQSMPLQCMYERVGHFTALAMWGCRYAVGVLDKETGVMRYAEVGTGSIIRMEPRARGVDYGAHRGAAAQEDDLAARILANKRWALFPRCTHLRSWQPCYAPP